MPDQLGANDVFAKYGIVSNGKTFAVEGKYYDLQYISTPEECAAQVSQLKYADEVCIMMTDPVLIVVKFPKIAGPVVFRTGVAPSQAQELVTALRPAGVTTYESGKILGALARLTPGEVVHVGG